MPRTTITADQQRDVAGLEAEERRLALEITHPDVPTPIRIVADTVDHVVPGDSPGEPNATYRALRFEGVLPQEREGEIPTAGIRIDNVGRPLTTWIERSGGGRGGSVRMMVLRRREPASEIVYELTLGLGGLSISGEHVSAQLTAETIWGRNSVKKRHTPEISPGVF